VAVNALLLKRLGLPEAGVEPSIETGGAA